MTEVDYESGRVDGYALGRQDEREYIISLISRNLCLECQTDGVPETIGNELSCAQAAALIEEIKNINE